MKHSKTQMIAGFAALMGSVAMAPAASAASYIFDFTNQGTGTAAAKTFTATGDDKSKLNVKVTAWHANDPAPTTSSVDTISSATLGYYGGAGLGVLFDKDATGNGTHQIDNVGGGSDFVMLQFDKDVTLNGIGRNLYSITGASCCDGDAAYWADSGNIFGSPSATANIDLTTRLTSGYKIDEGTFKPVADNGKPTGVPAAASVWLVSAAFNQSNDAFKLSGLSVSSAAAVPEPASWALMIGGVGLVGASLRRRQPVLATA